MASSMLKKMRRLNSILQTPGAKKLSFPEMCTTMRDILDSNVYVVSKRGKILGVSLYDVEDSAVVSADGVEQFYKDVEQKRLLKIDETRFNIDEKDLSELFEDENGLHAKFATIVPVIGAGERVATLVIARRVEKFTEEELILSEYAAAIIGLEIVRAKSDAHEEVVRKKAVVQMAISTLSYSEFEAIVHIFDELGGDEGLLVASKVADRAGITRSVIVNALRKFESAGVIETRSLGMKGTYIRVVNEYIVSEINKVRR